MTGEVSVRRVGFVLQVRPDMIDEYRRHHAAVWPEMLDALRRTGWRNYSLFLRPDGALFGYVELAEGRTFDEVRAAMDAEPVNARWQALMAPFFALDGQGGGHPADRMMEPLDEVFHLD
jgi:L-rhamnose mutarotase